MENIIRIILFIAAIAALALIWQFTPLSHYATPEHVTPLLDKVRNNSWALPAALALYIVGTMLFCPHIVMTLAVILVFPPLQSIPIVLIGSLMSGAMGYGIGRKLGMGSLTFLTGSLSKKIAYCAQHGGVIGLTLLRMVPTGPFTAVNILLGMSHAPFFSFLASITLGLLPSTVIGAFLGASFMENWQNANHEHLIYLAIGIAGWIILVAGTHYASRLWKKKHYDASPT